MAFGRFSGLAYWFGRLLQFSLEKRFGLTIDRDGCKIIPAAILSFRLRHRQTSQKAFHHSWAMAQTFLLGLARLAQKYKISLRNSFATISPQKFMLKTILMVLQVAVPILLMACILIQQKGTALGSAFGSEGGATYVKKRGLENKIFWASVVLGALFIIVSLINLLLTV